MVFDAKFTTQVLALFIIFLTASEVSIKSILQVLDMTIIYILSMYY